MEGWEYFGWQRSAFLFFFCRQSCPSFFKICEIARAREIQCSIFFPTGASVLLPSFPGNYLLSHQGFFVLFRVEGRRTMLYLQERLSVSQIRKTLERFSRERRGQRDNINLVGFFSKQKMVGGIFYTPNYHGRGCGGGLIKFQVFCTFWRALLGLRGVP